MILFLYLEWQDFVIYWSNIKSSLYPKQYSNCVAYPFCNPSDKRIHCYFRNFDKQNFICDSFKNIWILLKITQFISFRLAFSIHVLLSIPCNAYIPFLSRSCFGTKWWNSKTLERCAWVDVWRNTLPEKLRVRIGWGLSTYFEAAELETRWKMHGVNYTWTK